MITPGLTLAVLLVISLIALVFEAIRRGRRAERVRGLARRWGMNFGRRDTLRLTTRVARVFPVPGAAALEIFHVIYGVEGDRYRYIFTAQFTLGVIGPKSRHTRVATFSEPRDRRQVDEVQLALGDPELPLLAQYEALSGRSS
jgi:hypothetical protein